MSKDKQSRIMNFGVMMDSLLEAHKNVKNKKYGYNGPVFTSDSILATSPNIDEQFSKEEFEFRVEHKGRKPIELIISAAIQLGIQQGIYMCSDEPFKHLDIKDIEEFERQVSQAISFAKSKRKS